MVKYLFVLFVFLVGCCPLKSPEFVDLVHNHKELTTETMQSVILSIQDEMKELTLTEDEQTGMNDLILRLQTISKQSIIISDYVDHNMSYNDWSDFMRWKWKNRESEK